MLWYISPALSQCSQSLCQSRVLTARLCVHATKRDSTRYRYVHVSLEAVVDDPLPTKTVASAVHKMNINLRYRYDHQNLIMVPLCTRSCNFTCVCAWVCVCDWLTVRQLGWAGHIQALVGGVVRGGWRQSRWNISGQKSHDTIRPIPSPLHSNNSVFYVNV